MEENNNNEDNRNSKSNEFHTLKGYRMLETYALTESMEDYIEMIYRNAFKEGHTRIIDLSRMLNVLPSSASKMVGKLESAGLVTFPKYGIIKLTEKGMNIGRYLIWKHETIERFLCLLNGSDNETKETEQIEHFVSKKTAKNIEAVTQFMILNGWKTGK